MRKEFDRAILTAHGNVAVLTMNHPETLNAISTKMVRGLCAALDEIENPGGGFRAVLLTGEGRGFCSGANLAEPPGDAGTPLGPGTMLDAVFHPFLRRSSRLHVSNANNSASRLMSSRSG